MRHFLLFYDLAPDYAERRGAYRDAHLVHTWAASDRGDLALAGSLADPTDTNVLFFKGDGPEAAEDFARTDPYVLNEIVTGWRVREWMTAVGKEPASMAPRPQITST
ncbi:YciI-like protein [Puniceibacterium sp. IMCC21224]|uniref:YciI-like protein n=1 Tax=Puniceibacterium sp. IMCC21224 TaxID=1618204 RepID=UPI00064DBFAE|nr:YciI-like protein [Puniceibacterium sp. IMCC21224]KMK64974.1 hypothetical protein IMCC21224_12219 [Puniceibacterium sp. IMCC21224]